jgi:acyl-CoA thioester hydrolase
LNDYPFEITVEVRFRDLDPMGHVNNAVYATYFEMGRAAFFHDVFEVIDAGGFDFILARIEIDYLRPALMSDSLKLGLRISSVGKTSFTFEYLLSAQGESVASGRSVQVFFDYEKKTKKPIPETFREKVRPFLAGGGQPC